MDYLEEQKIKSKDELTREMHQLVLQTLQTADLAVSSSDQRCFELLGFDILLDSELRPWLLEVNMSPACKERGRLALELDRMGSGLLSLVGLIATNTYQAGWISLTGRNTRKMVLKKQS
jgi:hypothetical protein